MESVARDNDGGGVGGAAAGLGDTAGCGRREVEEVGEVFGCVFFDEGEDGGDLVDVCLVTIIGYWALWEEEDGHAFVFKVASKSSLASPTCS